MSRGKKRFWSDDEQREICGQAQVADGGVSVDKDAQGQPPSSLCTTRVDLTLSDGRRILIEGPTALSAVVGLVEGLAL